MIYQVTILHKDGTQENYPSSRPDYVALDEKLYKREITSFVVSLRQTA